MESPLVFHDEFQRQPHASRRSVENAIIISDVMVSFYTCLETAFLRISQFFENALDDARWHEQLLRAMTWTVPGVRERVISDATCAALSELPLPPLQALLLRVRLRLGAPGSGPIEVPGLPQPGPRRSRSLRGVRRTSGRGGSQGMTGRRNGWRASNA